MLKYLVYAISALTKLHFNSDSPFVLGADWNIPGSKVHVANMGPTWGRQDTGASRVGPMNLAIWKNNHIFEDYFTIFVLIWWHICHMIMHNYIKL